MILKDFKIVSNNKYYEEVIRKYDDSHKMYLEECYDNPSRNKYYIFYEIFDFYKDTIYPVERLRIISYNKFQFTIGFMIKIKGTWYLAYISKKKKVLIPFTFNI